MTSQKPRFRAISAEEAHLRQTLLSALCGRHANGQLLRASFLPDDAGATVWFRCAEDVAFRIPRLAGASWRIDADNGPAMAALLDAADGLLSAIEDALGLTLEPSDMGARGDRTVLIARIETLGGESCIDIALPVDVSLLATPAPFASALLTHVPVPLRIALDGPRLSPADAAALSPGDLLLVGAAPLSAQLHAPGSVKIAGRIAPHERLFRPVGHY